MKDQRLVERWMDIHDEIVERYYGMETPDPKLCAALILLAAIIQER